MVNDNNNSKDFFTKKDAVLVLSDGFFFEGYGCGALGEVSGEICFNTAMTGYQEVMTDLSYSGQIVCFTAPHIGNTGANKEDIENIFDKLSHDTLSHIDANHSSIEHSDWHYRSSCPTVSFAKGAIFRNTPTQASNFRALCSWDRWLKKQNITAICGIDTRFLTAHIRQNGMMNAVLVYKDNHVLSCPDTWVEKALALPNMQGQELTQKVMVSQSYAPSHYDTSPCHSNTNSDAESDGEQAKKFADEYCEYRKDQLRSLKNSSIEVLAEECVEKLHIVVIDFGAKINIASLLDMQDNVHTLIVPASESVEVILSYNADGYMLSNGPGDPFETGQYAIKLIHALMDTHKPVYGVCLGHQLIALALGMTTKKMLHGHHGVNHPVYNTQTHKVEICSMNHGFCVDTCTLPDNVVETHYSLFDRTNCGLNVKDKPIRSVQYHPESSPGPHDSTCFLTLFIEEVRRCKNHS